MKRTIKTALSLVLTITMILGLSIPVFANNEDSNATDYFYSEADYYEYILNSDEKELAKSGLTEAEKSQILTDFYNEVYRRAQMSDDELIALGYSASRIRIIHSISPDTTLSKEQIRAITATCSGLIESTVMTSSACVFTYSWSWNSCPFINLKDEVATKWIAFNSSGQVVDSDVLTASCYISYYDGSSLIHIGTGTIDTTNEDFYAIGYKFQSMYYYIGDDPEQAEQAYAKTGIMQVKILSNPGGTFDHVKVIGKYGHTTLVTSSIGFSVSNSHNLSFSFTPSLGISTVGIKKVNISFGPIVTELYN